MIQNATCIDTKDPLRSGRIKFSGEGLESDWAYPIAWKEGKGEYYWVPPEGSEIALLHHDGLYYYIGTTYAKNE